MYQTLTPKTLNRAVISRKVITDVHLPLSPFHCLPSPRSPPLVGPPGSERASFPRERTEDKLSLPPPHSLPSPPLPLSFTPAPSFASQLSFLTIRHRQVPEGDGDEGDAQAGAGGAGRAGGAGPGRVARQLLYSELLSRPGGPWAWMEVSGVREGSMACVPRRRMHAVLMQQDDQHTFSTESWHDKLRDRGKEREPKPEFCLG